MTRERGASLITAVFLITALAGLGVFLTRLLVMQSRETLNEWYSAQALYAAESGIDYAAYQIVTMSAVPSPQTIKVGNDATADVTWASTTVGTGTLWTIGSTGKAGDATGPGSGASRKLVQTFMFPPP